jgi:hypothetical protein
MASDADILENHRGIVDTLKDHMHLARPIVRAVTFYDERARDNDRPEIPVHVKYYMTEAR